MSAEELWHAPKWVDPNHFVGTLCGTPGPITLNRPTCQACLKAQEDDNG